MNSLVVLFALVAAGAAAPYGAQYVTYQQPGAVAYVPTAVSHQSRVDYNSPVVVNDGVVPVSYVAAGAPNFPGFYAANPYVDSPFVAGNYYGNAVVPQYATPGAVVVGY